MPAAAPEKEKPTGLALLREPFPVHQVSKLPKGTKAQNECPREQKKKCAVCGGFHHPDVVHLDYVGHAALTDRLLDADPAWTWEPMTLVDGLPAFDKSGGLWIRLTVCGVTRLGYGNAEGKSYMDVGSREKEVIGDALRNAAMRFGAALDLWHKGDLHVEPEADVPPPAKPQGIMSTKEFGEHKVAIGTAKDEIELKKRYAAAYVSAQRLGDTDAMSRVTDAKDLRKQELHDLASSVKS